MGENRWEIGVLNAGGPVCAKFLHRRGRSPPIIFARIVGANACLTTLSLTYVFTQRNFVADFLQAKCDFTRKTAVLRF